MLWKKSCHFHSRESEYQWERWMFTSFHLMFIPSIINGFLIGLDVYLMNVLHAVWIYFHTLQEHLDQVDKAFRWRQPAIIFVFRSLISQAKHMASKTGAGLYLMTSVVRTRSMCLRVGNTQACYSCDFKHAE